MYKKYCIWKIKGTEQNTAVWSANAALHITCITIAHHQKYSLDVVNSFTYFMATLRLLYTGTYQFLVAENLEFT